MLGARSLSEVDPRERVSVSNLLVTVVAEYLQLVAWHFSGVARYGHSEIAHVFSCVDI